MVTYNLSSWKVTTLGNYRSRSRSVDIVTRLRFGRSGIRIPVAARAFCVSRTYSLALGPTHSPVRLVPEVKRVGRRYVGYHSRNDTLLREPQMSQTYLESSNVCKVLALKIYVHNSDRLTDSMEQIKKIHLYFEGCAVTTFDPVLS
jgi:hypothetical protein